MQFTPQHFEKLRITLSAHLSEIMPEAQYREQIFSLIHDVKYAASEIANKHLNNTTMNGLCAPSPSHTEEK